MYQQTSFTNGSAVSDHYKSFINFMYQQSQVHADKVFARYHTKNGYNTLTYAQVDRLSTNLACKWAEEAAEVEIVSYMGEHNISYLIIMLAILKLRVTMMAISPRNSEAAVVNLLQKTQSKLMIAHVKYEQVAMAATAQVAGTKLILVNSFDMEALEHEPFNPNHKNLINTEFSDQDITKSALIIHSSGSTSFPKPIFLSNRYLFEFLGSLHINIEVNGGFEVNENDCFLSVLPLFHIFGFFVVFFTATVGGSTVILEKLPPSQQEIHDALVSNDCTAIAAPPLIYEQMIPYLQETNDYRAVQRLKVALHGGAPLKNEAAQWLQAHGLNVRNLYGTTETGCTLMSNFNPESENFGALGAFNKDANGEKYCVFETNDPNEPDIKHLYVRGDSPAMATGVANRADGGYDTNDLFREHPDFPDYYVYVGRRDDTLIMENGEKTNPVPMEATIRQSPIVKHATVLGHGRQCTAALIEVDLNYAMHLDPEEIISAVHSAVKKVNKECPNHSAILPQMVKILPFDKTLPSTDKGTVMRKKAEVMYKDMIEKLYKDFLEGPKRDATKTMDTSDMTAEQTEEFLISVTSEVLDIPKGAFKDRSQSVFDHGLNSITAIQLRNRIAEYFDNVSQNFLFQNPSIFAMREALLGKQQDAAELVEKQYQQAQELALAYLDKAKTDFAVALNSYEKQKKDKVVLLTGVTGSLGSFMLRDLLLDATVKKVYAVVRGKQEQLMDRLVDAFVSRSLDASLLQTDRVEVLPMRFSDSFLGFGEELYNKLRQEVTIVQHCAWLLDFNMPVDHYDKECIAPFYNLLKFAYHEVNPMHVHFISSVSASTMHGPEVREEPLPLDSHVCMPMGYAHSKFVVEVLFDYLTTEKNFPCYVERLGQICGDSENGIWNISEQYPLMFIGGGSVMHKMPALDSIVDWITVDYAAATVTDIMNKTVYHAANRDESIFHIVNPHTIHWSAILEAMKNAGMKFDAVSPAEWVAELEKDDSNPAYKLMPFYEANFKALNMPIWKTDKTAAFAPVISKTPVIDSTLFGKFLARWEAVGFYNPSA